jgi:hypothetical protein
VTDPDPPPAGAVAEVALNDTDPVAPDCVTVYDCPPMLRVAVRLETELFAAAVQLTVFPDFVAVNQDGAPVTVHDE